MADEPIGGVRVDVSGDLSPLIEDLQRAETVARDSGAQIAQAISQGSEQAAGGVGTLDDRIQALIDTGHTLSESLKIVEQQDAALADSMTAAGSAAESFSTSAAEAGQSASTLGGHVQEASTHAHEGAINFAELLEAGLALAGIEVGVHALADFVKEAIATYAAVERSTIALGALMGNAHEAEEAIEGLKELALSDALSFPQLIEAQQRFVAFGVDIEKIPGTLARIADAAAATNRDFGSTANVFERMIASGNVMGRTLVQLGLTTADLAKAMNVAEGNVKEAFKALDQEQRIDVLNQALLKFDGTAQSVADSLSGRWQRLKNEFEFASEGIGKSLAPVAAAFLDLAHHTVIPALNEIGEELKNWSNVISDVKIAAGFVNLTNLMDGLTRSAHTATTAGKDFREAWNLSVMQAGLGNVSETIRKIISDQEAANIKVNAAREAFDALSQSLRDHKPLADGHVATVQEVNRAHKAMKEAVDEANVSIKQQKQELDDYTRILKAVDDDVAKAYASVAIYKDIVGAFGEKSLQAAAAQREMESALKKVGLAAKEDLEPALAKASDTVQILRGHTTGASEELQKLSDKLGHFPSLAEQMAAGIGTVGSRISDTGERMSTLNEYVNQFGTIIRHSFIDEGIPAVDALSRAIEDMESEFDKWASTVGSFSPTQGAFRSGFGLKPGRASRGGFSFSGTPEEINQQLAQALSSGGNAVPLTSIGQRALESLLSALAFEAIQDFYRKNPGYTPGRDRESSAIPEGRAEAPASRGRGTGSEITIGLKGSESWDQRNAAGFFAPTVPPEIPQLTDAVRSLDTTFTNSTASLSTALMDLKPAVEQAARSINATAGTTAALLTSIVGPSAAPSIYGGGIIPAVMTAPMPRGGSVTINVNVNNADAARVAQEIVTHVQRVGVRF